MTKKSTAKHEIRKYTKKREVRYTFVEEALTLPT